MGGLCKQVLGLKLGSQRCSLGCFVAICLRVPGHVASFAKNVAEVPDVGKAVVERSGSDSNDIGFPFVENDSMVIKIFEDGLEQTWSQTDA